MFPYITFFGKQISVFSIAILCGLGLSALYTKLTLKNRKELEADIQLTFLYALVGAFIGAKLLYLATCLPEFISEFPYLFCSPELFLQKYLYGGFVFYGGMFGAFFAAWLYCKHCHLDASKIIGILLPAFPLTHAFGRLGCFFAGCCFGKPTSAFWGVTFHSSPFAPNGVPLVPVQLIEALAEFLLFGLTASSSIQKQNGQWATGIYFVSYGCLRFLLEFLRGDAYRGFIGLLSISQLLSLVSIGVGIFFLISPKRASQSV